MTRFLSADLARTFGGMVAALLLTTTFVAAAVTPANVAAPTAQRAA